MKLTQSFFVVWIFIALLVWPAANGMERAEVTSGLRSFFDKFNAVKAAQVFSKKRTKKVTRVLQYIGPRVKYVEFIDDETFGDYNYYEIFPFADGQQLKIVARLHFDDDAASTSVVADEPAWRKEGFETIRLKLYEEPVDLKSRLTLLSGVIHGTNPSVMDIVKEGTNWREADLEVDGFACTEVTVDHPAGQFSIAVSKEHGFAPLQIRVRKAGHHLHNNELMSSSGVTNYEKVFRYKRFDPQFKRLHFVSDSIRERENESPEKLHLESEWEVSKLDENTSLEPYCQIPNGTPLTIRHKNQLTAYWFDKQVVLPFDEKFIEKLNGAKQVIEQSRERRNSTNPKFWLILIMAIMVCIIHIKRATNSRRAT